MPRNATAYPNIVARAEWLAERRKLLTEEKTLTRARDALNAARRRLPMVRVEKDYEFTGPEGTLSLLDMFSGRSQLIVGHFMFDPEWENGCPSCTHMADEISSGQVGHLRDGNTEFAYVSRAPLPKIEAYKARRGWTFPWNSSFGGDFNYDFHVTLDRSVAPPEYNYKSEEELAAAGMELKDGQSVELPGFSMFLRIEKEIFHTYSTYARGGEMIGGSHYMLDLTAWGRQQDFEDSPDGWPQQPTYG
ncbi:MAG TPA: DUF899 domain-containing protein [Aurantimonas coralicida]|uniref:DUF899 domain-containing protein n=2 Tax=root TaxID=1 RepID=A0A9C9NJ16_9HYPH|nr:DUF899 domain-containing protein [Aurantimonas coralicida]HEU02369.1 DUF899 domain-containing protein [Aurantimonas coralicida]